jgi:hypothetical protein
MGKRGPKRVAVRDLRLEASKWAHLLFVLRDGQPGLIQKINTKTPWLRREGGGEEFLVQISPIVVARIVPAKNAHLKLPAQLRTKDYLFSRPVMPDSRSWNDLKRARSVQDMQRVAQSVRRWVRRFPSGVRWPDEFPRKVLLQFPRVVHAHAADLIKAKRMPHYPRTDRPRSDDKRVEFFAKILAGSTLGIAPATATKRLAHWNYPNPQDEAHYVSSLISIRKSPNVSSGGLDLKDRTNIIDMLEFVDPSTGGKVI